MRISNNMILRTALGDLQDINEQGLRLQKQLSSGRRYFKPSEDPAATVRALDLRQGVAADQTRIDSLKDGLASLTNTEVALDEGILVLQRARELTLAGGSVALGPSERNSLVAEMDQLLDQLVGVANRRDGDRYLFAGTASTTVPFTVSGDPTSAVTYQGDAQSRTVEPAPGYVVRVNLPGSMVFGTGASGGTDVFQALIDAREALRNGDINALTGDTLAGVGRALEQVIDVRTSVGAAAKGITGSVDSLEEAVLARRARLSEVEDVDFVEASVDAAALETRHRAALQAAARIQRPTLLDYLA